MMKPLLSAACAAAAWAIPSSSDAFVYALGVDADAYINGGASAGTNFGTNGNIVLKNGGAADNFARKGYLRFDVSTVPAPINDAVLSLTVELNNGGGSPAGPPQNFTVQVLGLVDGFAGGGGILGEDWNETAINWNNAPANNTGSGSGFDANAVLLGSFSVSNTDVGGSVVSFSSPELVDFLNADTNGLATVMLRRTGGNAGGNNNLVFRSSDNAANTPASLVVTIPEPSRAMLLFPGLAAAILRRRR